MLAKRRSGKVGCRLGGGRLPVPRYSDWAWISRTMARSSWRRSRRFNPRPTHIDSRGRHIPSLRSSTICVLCRICGSLAAETKAFRSATSPPYFRRGVTAVWKSNELQRALRRESRTEAPSRHDNTRSIETFLSRNRVEHIGRSFGDQIGQAIDFLWAAVPETVPRGSAVVPFTFQSLRPNRNARQLARSDLPPEGGFPIRPIVDGRIGNGDPTKVRSCAATFPFLA